MNQLSQTTSTAKDDLRATRILFVAILVGALIFAIIAFFVNQAGIAASAEVKEYDQVFLWVAASVAVICFFVANYKYNKGISVAKDSLISIKDKLNQYRMTLVSYVALCEGPALFAIILFFITGNYFFYVITGAMLILMLSKAPTLKRINTELGLDWQQQQELE